MIRKESNAWPPKWETDIISEFNFIPMDAKLKDIVPTCFLKEKKKVIAVFHHRNVDRTSLMVIDKKYHSQLGYIPWDFKRKRKNFHIF